MNVMTYNEIVACMPEKHIFTPADWKTYFEIDLGPIIEKPPILPWDKCVLAENPFSHCRPGTKVYFVFYVPRSLNGKPVTIAELSQHCNHYRFKFPNDMWYEKEHATHRECVPGWHMLLINLPRITLHKSFVEQLKLLGDKHRVPYLVTEVFKNILFTKKNGHSPNREMRARYEDSAISGGHMTAGHMSRFALAIGCASNAPISNIGMAAERIPYR